MKRNSGTMAQRCEETARKARQGLEGDLAYLRANAGRFPAAYVQSESRRIRRELESWANWLRLPLTPQRIAGLLRRSKAQRAAGRETANIKSGGEYR